MRGLRISATLCFLGCFFIRWTYSDVCPLSDYATELNFSHARYERFGYQQSSDDPEVRNQPTSTQPSRYPTADNISGTIQPPEGRTSAEQPGVTTAVMTSQGAADDLQDLSLDFLFGNVSRELCAHWVIHLDLSNNDLTYLPDTLFDTTSCYYNLVKLTLAHNRLRTLTPAMFQKLTWLESLDLSHNHISEVPPGVFHDGLQTLRCINLAHNQFTELEPWPYVLPLSNVISVNLSHNRISQFTNRMGVTLSREITGPGVDLTYNNLTRLDESQLSSYVGGRRLTVMGFYLLLKVNIKHNPLLCDCHVYWIVQSAQEDLVTQTLEAQNFCTCAAPRSLRDQPFGYLLQHPDLLVCDVSEGCPQGCQCLDTPHRRYLAVTCPPSRHNYTHIPPSFPGHAPVSLNLSHQALSSLEAGSADVSRLQVLDVSNNRLRQVLNSFLDAASSLQVLDLRNNLLTSLPSHLQRLSVSNLHLSGNPLQCMCDLEDFGNWVKAVSDNTSSSERAGSDTLTLQCSLPDGNKMDVADVSSWNLDCHSSITVPAIVGGGFALIAVVVAMVMCWRWRYHVRVLLNNVSSCCCTRSCLGKPTPVNRETYAMPNGEAEEQYGVYISLDENDDKIRMWTKTCLLPLLEDRGRNPPRVYLPSRQEPGGVCKAENRAEKISQSTKVLVILSPGYVSNGWCRFEFDHACCHLQDINPKNLVIVVMDDDPDVRKFIREGKTRGTENTDQKRVSNPPDLQNRDSTVCGVDVEGCNCDPNRPGGADVVIDMAQNGARNPARRDGEANLEPDGITGAEQIMLTDIPRGPRREQNTGDGPTNTGAADHVGVKVVRNGRTPTRNGEGPKLGKGRGKRRAISKTKRGKNNNTVRLRQAERIATEELKGKQLRQRHFLEEISQYTEDGQQVALEPLRSFLLEGRYVSAANWLFKYELLFEVTRVRKEVDFIDCD